MYAQRICDRGWDEYVLNWNVQINELLFLSWRRNQMETFSALLALSTGNSPVTGEFPVQRPVTQSFDVFFDLCLNKWLSKQWWGWWFETVSCPLWRHCNGIGCCVAKWFTSYVRYLYILIEKYLLMLIYSLIYMQYKYDIIERLHRVQSLWHKV